MSDHFVGLKGISNISNLMRMELYLNMVKKGSFSKKEKKRLAEMIKSPDPENFEVAKIIIDNKK